MARRAKGMHARLAALEASTEPAQVQPNRLEFARSLGFAILDPWQAKFLSSSSPKILLKCCRQSGKSTMASIIALHRAVYSPESLVLVLAPSERQAKELFSKVSFFYSCIVAKEHALTTSYRKLGMELRNGSRIEALPGTEKTVRGYSGVDLLLVDEAARVDDALYYSARPMLAVSGGSMIMLSTPYGKRGAFYEEWTKGAGWERYEVPATACPRIPTRFLEEERQSLPEQWFKQEYLVEFTEASGQVFAHGDVMAALDNGVRPLFDRR